MIILGLQKNHGNGFFLNPKQIGVKNKTSNMVFFLTPIIIPGGFVSNPAELAEPAA